MLKLNETEMRSVEGGAKATRYCSLFASKKCAKKYKRGKWKSGKATFTYYGGKAGLAIMWAYYDKDYYGCLDTDCQYN